MKLADLSVGDIARRMRSSGIDLRTGPFVTRIHSHLYAVAEHLSNAYSQWQFTEHNDVVDFHVAVRRSLKWSLVGRPRVRFVIDDTTVAFTFPRRLAVPMLEWGLNWCIYQHAHQYLIVHSAVLERDGHAVLLAAPPGSGKSTLCAALAQSGWRLMSDELALISPESGSVLGLARPICLKNESIQLIRRAFPHAVFGPLWHATHKGTVSHLYSTHDSIARVDEPAQPTWVVFPSYRAGAPADWQALTKGKALMQLVDNCFNYSALGTGGFEILSRLVNDCNCFRFEYSDLNDAISRFNLLVSKRQPLEMAVEV